ncbi:MAG: hypothetical protein K0U98_06595 [Deltaproteobacteria bacterium]|nr:hypothetical protein [Deltaproteobacteria bacterium]
MASQPESTAFNRDAGLRETFLFQLRPQEREILQRMTDCVLELAREGHCADTYPGPPLIAEARAIATDLRFLESLMRHISDYEDRHSPRLWHARLLVCLEDLASEIAASAARLESTIPPTNELAQPPQG